MGKLQIASFVPVLSPGLCGFSGDFLLGELRNDSVVVVVADVVVTSFAIIPVTGVSVKGEKKKKKKKKKGLEEKSWAENAKVRSYM